MWRIAFFYMMMLTASLAAGETLTTKKVSIKKEKHNEYQIAVYKHPEKAHLKKRLKVMTCLNDRYGIIVGLQTIYHGHKKISESQKVTADKVDGKSYVVHAHDHMTVYTSDDEQFIKFH